MKKKPILNTGHTWANDNSSIVNFVFKLVDKSFVFLKIFFISTNGIPIKDTEYFCIVISV